MRIVTEPIPEAATEYIECVNERRDDLDRELFGEARVAQHASERVSNRGVDGALLCVGGPAPAGAEALVASPAWEGAIAESAVRRDWGFRIGILVLGPSLEGVDGHTRRRALSPLTIGGGHARGSACGAVVVWCKLYFLRFFWACR